MKVLLLTSKKLGHESRQLVKSLEKRGHTVLVNDPENQVPDIVLARHLGKKNPTNLPYALYFQSIGVPVINTPQAVLLAKNKFETNQLFRAHGLPAPKTYEFTSLDHDIAYPLVAKVLRGSQGVGVYLCESREQLAEHLNSTSPMIIQEFVDAKPGQDLRVFIIGGHVMGVMKRMSINGDFRANISQGGVGEAYELTPEIEHLALTVAKLVGLDICGVDLLFDQTGFKVCEVNATPGFRGFDRYCGTKMADEIVKYLESKLPK
jgi:gamma-F420-2:alpha-L-glutamate ligase